MRSTTVVLVMAVAVGSLAIPVKRDASDQCATRCIGSTNKYRYETGKSYEYTVRSSTDIKVDGRTDGQQNVTQKADIVISKFADCEFSLKIKSIEVSGASVPSTFNNDVTRHALRFSFDDGIVGEICPKDNDPTWVLNIKRAILSSMQNAFQTDGHDEEHDVNGRCKTTYEMNADGEFERTKRLDSCKGSLGLHGAVRAVRYDAKSHIQSPPLSDGEQKCTHKIDNNGILKKAHCIERHQFKSFTDREEGTVRSTTRMVIQLVKKKDSVNRDHFHSVNNRHSLEFDHSEIRDHVSSEAKQKAHEIIDLLCATETEHRNRKDTPTRFTDLVTQLRKMDDATVDEVCKQAETQSKCESHLRVLLDALPMCGTESCVRHMVNGLKNKDLPDATRRTWFMSLAFVPRVSERMIEHVTDLVDGLHSKELLGIGSLVHTFCREHENCGDNDKVKALMMKLASKLGDSCKTEEKSEDIEKMVVTLKAIGNIGNVKSMSKKLQNCFETDSNPLEVRVAAIQAMRRMPCDHDKKHSLLRVFEDRGQDVEARIFAFLSVIKCAERHVVEKVNDVLETETVNQVGSFVWSYMREKRKSTNPSDAALKHALNHEAISRRFDRDPQVYSRFSESGSFSDTLNTGFHTETAMIMAPGSYLPRSTFTNITLHLFGHSVNLFEIGSRQEGLDHVLDNMFGPEGMLSNPNSYHFKNKENRRKHKNKKLQKMKEAFERRDIFDHSKRVSASLYLKVFGDELGYMAVDEENAMGMVERELDVKNIMDWMAKERKIKLAKDFLFVDTTKTIPTLSGLPLRLTITGATSLNVEMAGKADFTKIFKQPHDVEVMTSMKPTATVEVTTTLAVHTPTTKVGLTQKARLHTQIAVETELSMKGGKTFKAVQRLPYDRMEIFEIDVNSYNTVNDELVPLADTNPSTSRSTEYCTGSTWSRLFGTKLCAQMPSGEGNYKTAVYLEKTDKTLQTYETTLEFESTRIGGVGIVYPKEFVFNTPGSEVDREVRFTVDTQDEATTVELRTPMKELKFEGKVTNPTQDTTKGELVLTVDNTDRYEMEAKYVPSRKGSTSRFDIESKVKVNEESPVEITAFMESDLSKKQIKMGGEIDGLEDGKYVANAEGSVSKWSHSNKVINLEYSWTSPNVESGAQLLFDHAPKKCHVKLAANHKWKDGSDPWDMRWDLTKQETEENGVKKYTRKLEFIKSFYKSTNFVIEDTATHQRAPEYMHERKMNLKYGESLSKEGHMHLKLEKTKQHKYLAGLAAKMPEYNVDHKAKVTYHNDLPSRLHMTAELDRPGPADAKADVKFEMKTNPKYEMKMSAEAAVVGEIEYKLTKEVKQVNNHEYKSQTMIQWAPDSKVDIDADITVNHGGKEYMVKAVARSTESNKPIHFYKHVKNTGREMSYSAHLKQGDQSLYDMQMKLTNKERSENYNYEVKMQSHYLNDMDYQLDGSYELTNNRGVKFSTNVKRQQQDYARAQFLIAASPGLDWADRIQLKSQLDAAKYVWDATIEKSDHYKMNNTIKKNDKEIIVASWASQVETRVTSPKFAVDFALKTDAPLKKRHLTGLIAGDVMKRRDPEPKMSTYGEFKCHTSKKRIMWDMEWQAKNHYREVTHRTDIEIGSVKISMDGDMKHNEQQKSVTQNQNFALEWAPNKKITHTRTLEVEGPHKMTLVDRTTTPFPEFEQNEWTYKHECSHQNKNCKGSFEVEWKSNGKTTDISTTGDYSWADGHTLDLKMIGPSKKPIDLKVGHTNKREGGKQMMECLAEIKWNAKDQVNLRYTSEEGGPDYTSVLLWEAKIKDVCELKARAEHERQGQQIKSELLFKNAEDVYKVASDVNLQDETGMVKVQTPMNDLKSGRLQITKLSDNKYKIESERNGESGAVIEGELSGDRHNRLANIKITNINKPVEIDFAYKPQGSGQPAPEVKLIAKVDDKPYGFEVSHETGTASEYEVDAISLTLVHPKRKPQVGLAYLKTQGHRSMAYELRFTPDKDTRANPTRIGGRMSRTRDAQHVHGLEYTVYLNDPALSHPLEGSVQLGGAHQVQVRLQYSDLQSKALKITVDAENKDVRITVKHDASNLDHKYWFSESEGDNFDLGMEYKANGKMNKFAISYKDTATGMEIGVVGGKLKFEEKPVSDGIEYRMMWFESGKQKPNWVLAVKSDRKNYHHVLELRKAVNGKVVLHASDRLVSPEKHEQRLWHIENQKRVDDVHVKLWLAKPNLLKYRSMVRPDAWEKIVDVIEDMGRSGVQSLPSYNSAQARDCAWLKSIMDSADTIDQQINDHVKPMCDYYKDEKKQMTTDFGIPTLMEYMDEYSEIMWEVYGANMDIMEMTIRDWTESASEDMGRIGDKINDGLDSMWDVVAESMRALGSVYDALVDLIEGAARSFRRWNQSMQDFVRNNDVMRSVGDFITRMEREIKKLLRNMDFKEASRAINRYLSQLEAQYGNVVDYARDYLDTTLEYGSLRDMYTNVQPMLDEITTVDLRDLMDRAFEYLKSLTQGDFVQKYMPRVTLYQPDQGKFEIELPLPVRANSLRQLVKHLSPEKALHYINKANEKWAKIFSTHGPISDELWNRKGITQPQSFGQLRGTHKSTAFIVNPDQHLYIITFDGHSYVMDRPSELVLANDFIGQGFSIVGDFKRNDGQMKLRKIKVTSGETEIEIRHGGKVFVGGSEVELPWQKVEEFDDRLLVSVKRTDHGTLLRTFDDVIVEADWFWSNVRITLPKHYYGHSAGLLGSNDMEHSNDFALPNGEANEDSGRFFNAYTLGDSAPAVSAAAPVRTPSTECDDKFKMRQSALRTCFRRVPPRAFHDMCSDENICNVTASYVAACNHVGLDLMVPEDCLSCTKPSRRHRRNHHGHHFMGGDTKRIESQARRQADVVFVVMENRNMEFAKEKVNEVANKMESKLSGWNVRYGVIGFEGLAVHSKPHMHTGNYAVMFDKQGLTKAVASLDMEGNKWDATVDPLTAIHYAASSYPFRALSTKTIILWTAAQCGQAVNYYDVQGELLQRGIQLHVLTTERIEVGREHDSELMGFDASRMYTTSGEDESLRDSLSRPHDSCTVLAQETNGTVFTVADKESSVFSVPADTMAHRIQAAQQRASCAECECDSHKLAPRTVCYPCEVPMPVSLSSHSFFNMPYINLRNTIRKAQKTIGNMDVYVI